MSGNGPALLAAVAGVGLGHGVLPDHWLPLAVLGRTRRYRLSRVVRLSGLAGVAHVLVSIALGAVIIAVGLQLRSSVELAEDTIVGLTLAATQSGYQIRGQWLERWGNVFTALVLVIIGALVLGRII